MTQALATTKHHNLDKKKRVKSTAIVTTEQAINVGITVEKTVLIVQAKTVVNSVNLEVGTNYYAEVHGKAHYFISRFPSGKLSHMGVYQKEYFKVIGEEVVTYEPRLHELKQLRRGGKLSELQLQQLAAFESGSVPANDPTLVDSETTLTEVPDAEPLVEENVQEPTSEIVEEESNTELTEKVKALLDNSLLPEEEREARLRQQAHEQSRPDDEAYPHELLHERVYSAELNWCKYGYRAEVFVGKRLFIKRISKDNPYYKASDCAAFTDQGCTNPLAGRLKLAWFTDFQLIEDEVESLSTLDEEQTTSISESETTAVSLTDVVEEESPANISADIKEIANTVEEKGAPSKDAEEASLELEQLSLFF